MKDEVEEEKERTEQIERELENSQSNIKEMREEREKLTEEAKDSDAILEKTQGEVERLWRRYNEMEEEWGEKMHTEMKRRGELLRVSETKFKDLIKQRDKSHEYSATWKKRAEAVEKEAEALQAMLTEVAKKAEEKEEENKRAMGQVLEYLSHTREKIRLGEEEKNKVEVGVGALRAKLVQVEKKEAQAEDAPARHLRRSW